MQLDLSRYRRPLERVERTFEPSELQQDGEVYRIIAPVHLAFDVHKDKDKFRLAGTVRTELELACSRCVEPFRMPVELEFDQRYLPHSEASSEEETQVEEDDLETSYYREGKIDLDELLREQFYLALPMKPLCQEDCRGLCPLCGTNLNTGTCACAPAWEDPRLAALKELKSRES